MDRIPENSVLINHSITESQLLPLKVGDPDAIGEQLFNKGIHKRDLL